MSRLSDAASRQHVTSRADPTCRAFVPPVFLEMNLDADDAESAWTELWLATLDPEKHSPRDARHLAAYRLRFERVRAYEAALTLHFDRAAAVAELNLAALSAGDPAPYPSPEAPPRPAPVLLPAAPWWETPRDHVVTTSRRQHGPMTSDQKARMMTARRFSSAARLEKLAARRAKARALRIALAAAVPAAA